MFLYTHKNYFNGQHLLLKYNNNGEGISITRDKLKLSMINLKRIELQGLFRDLSETGCSIIGFLFKEIYNRNLNSMMARILLSMKTYIKNFHI